jgi:hypothetical protein
LLNSSFISSAVFFISYISFLIISLISFWSLLKFSLRSITFFLCLLNFLFICVLLSFAELFLHVLFKLIVHSYHHYSKVSIPFTFHQIFYYVIVAFGGVIVPCLLLLPMFLLCVLFMCCYLGRGNLKDGSGRGAGRGDAVRVKRVVRCGS